MSNITFARAIMKSITSGIKRLKELQQANSTISTDQLQLFQKRMAMRCDDLNSEMQKVVQWGMLLLVQSTNTYMCTITPLFVLTHTDISLLFMIKSTVLTLSFADFVIILSH